ncbi:hypothetical protein [Virgibacillus salexigens]|uniref:Uncharacterized protein n=1 Tax=Virgibacillus massiliensis TaxID=1462526 RepID=A0A024QAM6_9BACI|nr:hypothetical protein [Virgibacillus massiliensis]CDQ39529.1 hypothetical protein BN990_01834 [Virgibacillus massiliensis]
MDSKSKGQLNYENVLKDMQIEELTETIEQKENQVKLFAYLSVVFALMFVVTLLCWVVG